MQHQKGEIKYKISRQRISACSFVTLHASATILSSTVLLWTTPKSTWAAVSSERENGVLRKQAEFFPNPLSQRRVGLSRLPNSVAQVQIPVVPFELQNTPKRFQQNPQFGPYRLGRGDSISVVVPRFPELNGTFAIDSEGNVLLPLVGKLQIDGFTLEEAQEKIRNAFNRFVVDPTVTVALATPRPVQITLTGEIFRPGFYPLGFGARLSGALLAAGGATPQADLRGVLIRRFLSDGSYIEQRVDLFTPLIAGEPQPDLYLQDGDTIVIPKLEVGNESTYDRQLVGRSTLAKPTITIRVINYPNNTIGNIVLPNGSNFIDAVTAISPNLQQADVGNIALVRFDPERGRAIVRELNAKRALFGETAQNVPLRDYDVIVIGRTFIARLNFGLSTLTQPFRDVMDFFDFVRTLTERFNEIFLGPRNQR